MGKSKTLFITGIRYLVDLPEPAIAIAGPPESPKQVSLLPSSCPAQNILVVIISGRPRTQHIKIKSL